MMLMILLALVVLVAQAGLFLMMLKTLCELMATLCTQVALISSKIHEPKPEPTPQELAQSFLKSGAGIAAIRSRLLQRLEQKESSHEVA